MIRAIEQEIGRPIGILADLQGPKLRVGTFADGPVHAADRAQRSASTSTATPGDATARQPAASRDLRRRSQPGVELLLDDGKLRLRVERCGADCAETAVVVGGAAVRPQGRQRARTSCCRSRR